MFCKKSLAKLGQWVLVFNMQLTYWSRKKVRQNKHNFASDKPQARSAYLGLAFVLFLVQIKVYSLIGLVLVMVLGFIFDYSFCFDPGLVLVAFFVLVLVFSYSGFCLGLGHGLVPVLVLVFGFNFLFLIYFYFLKCFSDFLDFSNFFFKLWGGFIVGFL